MPWKESMNDSDVTSCHIKRFFFHTRRFYEVEDFFSRKSEDVHYIRKKTIVYEGDVFKLVYTLINWYYITTLSIVFYLNIRINFKKHSRTADDEENAPWNKF